MKIYETAENLAKLFESGVITLPKIPDASDMSHETLVANIADMVQISDTDIPGLTL